MDMGFPVEACKRALYFTKNESLENATNWIMEHFEDPILMEPLPLNRNQINEASGGRVKQ